MNYLNQDAPKLHLCAVAFPLRKRLQSTKTGSPPPLISQQKQQKNREIWLCFALAGSLRHIPQLWSHIRILAQDLRLCLSPCCTLSTAPVTFKFQWSKGQRRVQKEPWQKGKPSIKNNTRPEANAVKRHALIYKSMFQILLIVYLITNWREYRTCPCFSCVCKVLRQAC